MKIEFAVNEEQRLLALHSYHLIDSGRHDFFDRITSMTATALDMPVSVISLVDRDRIYFKSAFGLDVDHIPREPSFCSNVVLSNEVYEIEDTTQHSPTRLSELVTGALGVRFYAAAPLIDPNGYRLGTLCVLSQATDKLTHKQRSLLIDLAKVVVDEILLWHTANQLKIETEKRLRIESAVAKKEKLEALGVMVGGVAHDLNNIMLPITTNADLLSHNTEPEVANLAKEIKNSAFRCAQLCNHLLTSAGQKEPDTEVVHPSAFIEEGVKRFTALYNPAHISIQIDQDIDYVKTDCSKLAQVIVNLVANAVESASGATEVTITATTVQLDELALEAMSLRHHATPGKYVSITVSDTGDGMNPPTLRRMFDPFFTTKPSGTGMGLSFVAGLLRSQNSPVHAQSEQKSGTLVCFCLLAFDKVATPEQVLCDNHIPHEPGRRILFVDDDTSVRRATIRVLTLWKFEVSPAATGQDAVTLFRKQPDNFDLAIVDLSMPDMDGLAVVKEILAIVPDFPIIIYTGNPLDRRAQQSLDAGAKACLCKPFSRNEFEETLIQISADSKPASENDTLNPPTYPAQNEQTSRV